VYEIEKGNVCNSLLTMKVVPLTGCSNFLLQDHLGQCAKYPLLCPNKCGLLIPREKVRRCFSICLLLCDLKDDI